MTTFGYYQIHTITSSSELTDYQLKFTINKSTGSSNGSIIYCNDHCNDNFSDLRFSLDQTNLLSYWIESYVSGTSAVVWVKLPSITTTQSLYIYYGSVGATSKSNGENTFDFFDDFTNGLTKWNILGDTPTIVNGILTTSTYNTYLKTTVSTFVS